MTRLSQPTVIGRALTPSLMPMTDVMTVITECGTGTGRRLMARSAGESESVAAVRRRLRGDASSSPNQPRSKLLARLKFKSWSRWRMRNFWVLFRHPGRSRRENDNDRLQQEGFLHYVTPWENDNRPELVDIICDFISIAVF
jgi:hypothetical protein